MHKLKYKHKEKINMGNKKEEKPVKNIKLGVLINGNIFIEISA